MKNSVSVIIPTYNRAGLVGRAVTSVLAAASPGDEVLVIDDGSTDATGAALRPFGEAIRYIRIENSGPGAARNVGIREARCPYVTFLDSDDEWIRDKLELQRAVMDAFPDVVLCFSNLLARRLDGELAHDVLSEWRTSSWVGCADADKTLTEILGPGVPFSTIAGLPEGRPEFTVHVGDIYPALMEVYYVFTGAIMVRKEAAGPALRFPEDLRIAEDWECFARVARLGPAAYLDCELAVQVVHEGPRLTGAKDIEQATARIAILQRVWGTDELFLKVHSARYQSILKGQYLRRAKLLIAEGQLEDARKDLAFIGGYWPYRILASLPPALVRNILSVRRKIRGARD
jgi:glycosyltransferase involved in cell wall biosynthesis